MHLPRSLLFNGILIFCLSCQETKFTGSTIKTKCQPQDTPHGVDVLILMDNSTSLKINETDYLSSKNQNEGQKTFREQAVLNAFDELKNLDENKPPEFHSTLTMFTFTPEKIGGDRHSIPEDREIQLQFGLNDRTQLEKDIEFLRNPKGDTNYRNGFEYALEWLNGLTKERPKLILMATDGLPTDAFPLESLSLLDELNEKQAIDVILITKKDQTLADITEEHQQYMNQNYPEDHWHGSNFTDYFQKLMKIPNLLFQKATVTMAPKIPKIVGEKVKQISKTCNK